MPALIRALVKPELLVWARESARLTVAESAKKAQVSTERLASWERGDARPTIGQLRKLGRIYKRPIAVFYLAKPPKTFQAMHDFRRLPAELLGTQSPELAFEIRRAWTRREIALDLYRDLIGSPRGFSVTGSLDDDPDILAARLRDFLGVDRHESSGWKTLYDALNRWREAFEEAGVLVFQVSGVAVSEMRGFSISEMPFPVIAVNVKDALSARVFSMLHEATHLMLRDGGLCDVLDEASMKQRRVEAFCNQVAAATLVPKDLFLEEQLVREQRGSKWSDETIAHLARRYWVSREVILRRLLVLGRTTTAFYKQKRQELHEDFEAQQKLAELEKELGRVKQGYASPDRMAVSTAGPFFVRLVLDSYHREKITASDLASFLAVRLKHVPKIERAVFRGAEAAGAGA